MPNWREGKFQFALDLIAHRARNANSARFGERFESVRLLIPYDEGGRLAELYALGMPVDERADREEGVFIRAHLPMREVRRFAQYLIVEPETEARSSA